MLTGAYCHSTGEVGTGQFLGFLASQFTLLTEFQPSERACLKGAGQFLGDIQGCPLASVRPTHTHATALT